MATDISSRRTAHRARPHTTPTVSLVLIVRNEEAGLRAILPQIPTHVFDDLVAVDGHSSDASVALLNAAGYRTFLQCEKGIGAAMLEARAHVKTDCFVFFHPDGNEDPADLPRMVDLLRDGRPFVVASRMIAGAWNEEDDKLFKWRKLANKGFIALANLLFGRNGNRTSDVTNGFRGISCRAFDQMQLTSRDLTLDYQMCIRALKCDIPITEFPTREGSRVAGETNFPSISTGLAEMKLLWRECRLGRRRVA
jgi:glycosyltransferase involved in cell wall biosynthesis